MEDAQLLSSDKTGYPYSALFHLEGKRRLDTIFSPVSFHEEIMARTGLCPVNYTPSSIVLLSVCIHHTVLRSTVPSKTSNAAGIYETSVFEEEALLVLLASFPHVLHLTPLHKSCKEERNVPFYFFFSFSFLQESWAYIRPAQDVNGETIDEERFYERATTEKKQNGNI